MRAVAARMDDPLGDAFVVEVEDLFAQSEVFQQGRARRTDPQRILIVSDDYALRCRQSLSTISGVLMDFAPPPRTVIRSVTSADCDGVFIRVPS